MKKRVLLLTGCISMATVMPSFAADGPYFTIMAGATFVDDSTWTRPGASDTEFEYETAYNVGGALGYKYGMFRIEGEIAYRQNDFERFRVGAIKADAAGDIDALSAMANVYFDFENHTAWTPFIGAGAGWANIDVDGLNVSGFVTEGGDDDGFAYQFIGGFGYEVSEALTANLEYRYFAADDPQIGAVNAEYETHNIVVGLRYIY